MINIQLLEENYPNLYFFKNGYFHSDSAKTYYMTKCMMDEF